jgi:hypothetical protein
LDGGIGIFYYNAVLWPFDEVLSIEVGIEGFGHRIEIYVVKGKHVEERKFSDSCHFVSYMIIYI